MGESLKVELNPDTPKEPEGINTDHIVQTGENRVEAQVDDEGNPVTPSTERPTWLPEKFKSPEDMAKAYGELEKAHTQKSQEAAGGKIATPADAPTDQVVKYGIDLEAMSKEFADKGELTPESLKTLEAAGINADTVETYVEGQKARAAQTTSALAAVAGGTDELQATLKWAEENLDKAEIDAYNDALESKNLNLVKLALQGIVSQQREANPGEPNLVGGGRAPRAGDVQPYGSQAEIVLAMQDPRYKVDPAYRAEVEQRLNVS